MNLSQNSGIWIPRKVYRGRNLEESGTLYLIKIMGVRHAPHCETDPVCTAASSQLTSKNLAQCLRVIGGWLKHLDGIVCVCFFPTLIPSISCILLVNCYQLTLYGIVKSSSKLLSAASRNQPSFTTTISVDDFSPLLGHPRMDQSLQSKKRQNGQLDTL